MRGTPIPGKGLDDRLVRGELCGYYALSGNGADRKLELAAVAMYCLTGARR
jgi:hypothetical protein